MDKNDILNRHDDFNLSAYVNFMALKQAALKEQGTKVPEFITKSN
ncbi:unnamed protein product [Paramecium pentaurelia]|uniref:Uncharacterized protein n=1 Tax=Paramecium pentaurelia TaxID=43138 RepID=A0A8S1WEG6_9CILI|nr:unnamed protein product [Paramecium pentaurelia]